MIHGEQIILRDQRRYTAHPHMARLGCGTIVLVATSGPRRPTTLHPPLDPKFINVMVRSQDDGRTWSEPHPVPTHAHQGMECAGLTALPDGSVLLNQWQFRWYASGAEPSPDEEPDVASAADLQAELDASPELRSDGAEGLIRWSRGGGNATVARSHDAGRSWSAPVAIDVAPFSGGYGMRGGVVLPTGEVVLLLSDVPNYARVFLVRSSDNGMSWSQPEQVAAAADRLFEEPAPYLAPDGALVVVLRENTTRTLYSVRSTDNGQSWTAPQPTKLSGYPADLVRLGGDRVAAVTGVREAPGEVRLYLSDDAGASWSADAVRVARDFGTHDCGYPTAVALPGGELFVAYYRQDETGVTGLYGQRVRPNQQ